jgi:hypothetical protein
LKKSNSDVSNIELGGALMRERKVKEQYYLKSTSL